MAVERSFNFLSQMRVDVPHLKMIESGVAADFDVLAGAIMAGKNALVVKGFTLADPAGSIGAFASNLQIVVDGGILLHGTASEAGTIFAVTAGRAPESLGVSNPLVTGGFTANATNYIGLDLKRSPDDSTSDLVQFIAPNTRIEVPRVVPLGLTLNYRIIISASDFTSQATVCPLFKCFVNTDGTVASIVDARQMYFRLGSGGTTPDPLHTFPWLSRTETATGANIFTGGDKDLDSEKAWKDAVMTRLWEGQGGEHWYSDTSDREVKLAMTSSTLGSGRNIDFNVGTGAIAWAGLVMLFGNSTSWFNVIADGGSTIADGQCLYVDIDRTTNRQGSTPPTAALVMTLGTLTSLGSPMVPGSRWPIIWRKGNDVFARDFPFEVTRDIGLPPDAGDPLNVLMEGTDGTHVWARITEDMIITILRIASFAPNTTRYEKAVSVATPAFTATYGGTPSTPTSAALTDDQGTASKNVVSTPGAFTSNGTFVKSGTGNPGGNTATFTLTADAGSTPSVKTSTILWTRYMYFGASGSSSLNTEAGIKALADQVLAFDGQTANFTVGATVTGGTSGAKGFIVSQVDSGTTGTLRLSRVTGVFVDNEALTDSSTGVAVVNGASTPFSKGGKILTPTENNQTLVFSGSNTPATEYIYFAYPAYYGVFSKIIDNITGFNVTAAYTQVTSTLSITTDFDNSSVPENYLVYRSNQSQTGPINITVFA